MFYFLKTFKRLAADSLGRRIRKLPSSLRGSTGRKTGRGETEKRLELRLIREKLKESAFQEAAMTGKGRLRIRMLTFVKCRIWWKVGCRKLWMGCWKERRMVES